MTTAQYPVTATPYVVFQSGQRQPAYGLTNTGQSTIYLASTPPSGPADGWPLNPQATAPWSAGQYLAVSCATGQTSTLDTVDAPVGLFDPSAVATQLNLVGVPAIDAPVVLVMTQVSVPTATIPAATPIINVAKFQSVFLSGSEIGAAASANTRTYTLTWYADAAASQVLATDRFAVGVQASSFQVQRPVRGAYLIVTYSAATTTSTTTLSVNVLGSLRSEGNRTLLRSGRNNTTGQLQTSSDALEGLVMWQDTITGVATTKVEYPDFLMGCYATVSVISTATLSNIIGVDLETFSGQAYWSTQLTSSIAQQQATIWLPPVPLLISVVNFSSGTPDFSVRLVAQPQ